MRVFNLFRSKKKEDDKKATSRFIDDDWLEVSANSKDEAIERACVALNTNPTHLEVKFLSKDGKKIRARKASPEDEKTDETTKPVRKEKQGQRRNARGERGNSRSETKQASRRGQRHQEHKNEQTDEMLTQDEESHYNSRGEEDVDSQDYNDNQQYKARHNNVEQEEDFVEEVEEETDLGRKAQDILLQIVQKIEPNAKLELYETNKTIRLEIISSESGLFIGKFGQTLDSIQHLLKKILEIKFEDGKNLVVDAENYRVRREESIETKARKLAKKARQEGRPVSVEPMNAMDRRIVHMALKGEPGIETKSVGEGSTRRVLIVPKRRSSSRNGGSRDDGGRGRGKSRGGRGRGHQHDRVNYADGNSRMHDSYDVPSLPKNEVFGDNPEEYFENYEDEK